MAKAKVSIIGDGNVGSALHKGLTRAGYETKMVGKDPAKVKELGKWADVIVLAVPYGERANVVEELGDVSGKVLADVTNAFGPGGGFAHDLKRSGAEDLQAMAQGAKVVKAFNTIFAQNMAEGTLKGEKLSLFVAGDAKDAKERVLEMGRAIGFDGVDAGPLENARWLEAFGFFNVVLGFGQKMGSGIGFKLVR